MSPSGARSARESPAISWATRSSTNTSTPACGSRSTNLAAWSNSATTASRSRSAMAPRNPPLTLVSVHFAASPVACQTVHSTSSAVPPCRTASAAPAMSFASRSAGSATWGSTLTSSRTSFSAATSSSPDERGSAASRSAELSTRSRSSGCVSASCSAIRSVRRRRRTPIMSVPPSGAGQQLLRQRLVEDLRMERDLEQPDQRPHARLLEQRHLAAADHDRHPGRDQRPAQQRHLARRRPHQHRHPRPGDAVQQVRPAERVGDDRGLLVAPSVTRTRTSPGSASGRGRRSRCAAPPGVAGSRAVMRREAFRSSEPLRRQTRSAMTGAFSPVRVDGTYPETPGFRGRRRRGSRRSTGRGRRPR